MEKLSLKLGKSNNFILNKLVTFTTFLRSFCSKKLITKQSYNAHFVCRVGTASESLAKLSYLIEEPSYLPAELQILVLKPDKAFGNFLEQNDRLNVVKVTNSF